MGIFSRLFNNKKILVISITIIAVLIIVGVIVGLVMANCKKKEHFGEGIGALFSTVKNKISNGINKIKGNVKQEVEKVGEEAVKATDAPATQYNIPTESNEQQTPDTHQNKTPRGKRHIDINKFDITYDTNTNNTYLKSYIESSF